MDVLRAAGSAESGMAGWGIYEYATLGVSVLLSLLVSNAIAWWIERDRRVGLPLSCSMQELPADGPCAFPSFVASGHCPVDLYSHILIVRRRGASCWTSFLRP